MLVAGLSTTVAIPAHAATNKPAAGPIAFEAGNGAIWLVKDAAGSIPVRIASGFSPAWSPDGSKIAYEHENAVWVMNADGTGNRRITKGGIATSPTWSPDGTHIAYTRWEKAGPESTDIYLSKADGSHETPLTNDHVSFSPVWRPKSQQISFESQVNNHTIDSQTNIDLINSDGTHRRVLVRNMFSTPGWSADGTRFVVAGKADSIVFYNAAGQVTGTIHDGHSSFISYPAFSSGGTRLVYESNLSIATAKLDGSNFRIVATPQPKQFVFRSPAWRP
jgi:TolB protein